MSEFIVTEKICTENNVIVKNFQYNDVFNETIILEYTFAYYILYMSSCMLANTC